MQRDESGGRYNLRPGVLPGRSVPTARAEEEGEDDGFAAGAPLDEATTPPVAFGLAGTAEAVPADDGIYEGDVLTTTTLRMLPKEEESPVPVVGADEPEEPRGWRMRGSARDLGAAAVRGGVLEVVAVEDVARRLATVLEPFEQLLLRASQIDADQERITRDLRSTAAEVRSEGAKFLEGLGASRRAAARESAAVTELLGRTRETGGAAGSAAAALLAALRECVEETRILGQAAGAARETIEREMGGLARRVLRWYLYALGVTLSVTAVFVFAILWVVAWR